MAGGPVVGAVGDPAKRNAIGVHSGSYGIYRALAIAAHEELSAAGTRSRVVSLPCWELFEAQPAEYRDEILPRDVKSRLSVEAGVALGWKQWVGDDGDSISIEHYGASAPGGTVLEKFGYTVDNVVERALALRARVA